MNLNRVETSNEDIKSINNTKEDLYMKEVMGKSDAEDYPKLKWFLGGLFLGFFIIPFIWLIQVKIKNGNHQTFNTNLERQVYFKAYSTIVRKKRLIGAALAWSVWFGLIILGMFGSGS